MRALLLAAGVGRRLRPLTDELPKPMISIDGKPVLQHNVELLREAGITELIVNVHYRAETVMSYFGDGGAFGVRIEYSREPELLGTAGAARRVADRLGGEDFVVVYADNLSTIDLRALVEDHRRQRADLTMALFRRTDPSNSGIAEVKGDGTISRFVEKPPPEGIFSSWVNAGYLVAAPSVLEAIPSRRPSDFGRDVIPALLTQGARVCGYRMTEGLWWIDTMADYRRTQAEFSHDRPA